MQQIPVVVILFAFAITATVFYLEGTRSSTLAMYQKTIASQLQGVFENMVHSGAELSVRSSWVRHYYAKQSQQRVELLQSMGNAKDFRTLYNVIVPEVQCPNLVRVGTVLDGGKYVCNPLSLPEGMCRIYSLGLSHQITFDQEIYEITGKRCRIHGYDVHPPSLAVKKAYESMNGTLETKFISRSKGNRIQDIFEKNGDTFADILKIDIEGSEHATLIPFLSDGRYSVCQILIEIHGDPSAHLRLLVSLAKLDYALFSYEINPAAIRGCEYCFIHVDCMQRYGAVELKRYLNLIDL